MTIVIMEAPNANCGISDLEYDIRESLVMCLERHGDWKLVAEKFGIFSDRDIARMQGSRYPTYELILALSTKFCNVGAFCLILEQCQLYDALSILKEWEPVVVISQPSDEDTTQYVPLDGVLQLACQATGLPQPQYLWYRDNNKIENQTSPTLFIEHFQPEHKGNYYCCISQPSIEQAIDVSTNTVNVEVLPEPLVILRQPISNTILCEGDELILSCVVRGYPIPEVQWLQENTLLRGQDKESLRIEQVTMSHAGNYRCYIRSSADEIYSDVVNVTVRPNAKGSRNLSRNLATEKVALLIANDTYLEFKSLGKPTKDVITLTKILTELGFKVIALQNLKLDEMRNAITSFCELLPRGAYAFFYYAGHGFEMQDKYMLPINAPDSKSYLRVDSLCEKEVMRSVLVTKPRLFVILLDMCLRVPDMDENPGIYNEVPDIIKFEPNRNLVQGYATTSNLGAYERDTEPNGVYVKHLKKLLLCDLPIHRILELVGDNMSKDKDDVTARQMSSHSGNVVENFYLNDAVIGDAVSQSKFDALTCLPDNTILSFHKIGAVAQINYKCNVFLNSIEVWLGQLENWQVECETDCKDLELMLKRKPVEDNNDIVLTILMLQRLHIPLMITISLYDKKSGNLVDNGIIELGLPLIAPARLWFSPVYVDSC